MLDLAKDLGTLQGEMHPKTRYNIKVAAKNEVAVTALMPGNGDPALREEAALLLTVTASRQGYKSHSRHYYERLLEFFSDPSRSCTATLYTATRHGALLAAAVMVDFGTTRTYLFGGSSNEQRNAMAPYALHWTAIRDARKAGRTRYDFWGIETSAGAEPGFVRFKRGWGGFETHYPEPRDIVFKRARYALYAALRKLNRS